MGQPPNIFVRPDRNVLQLLDKANQLLKQERYSEAVRCLGATLESPQDYFLNQDKQGSNQRSLKSEAQAILSRIPSHGRQLYEVQFGARARKILLDSVDKGDINGLEEVSRRFFHTQAGYEASLILGFHHMDAGRPLAGALVLDNLRNDCPTADQFEPTLSLALSTCWLRAGMGEKAADRLTLLRKWRPDTKVTIAGKQVSLFDEKAVAPESLTQNPAWKPLLDKFSDKGIRGALTTLFTMAAPEANPPSEVVTDWTMFRGNPARNVSTSGSEPLLSVRWQQRATRHPGVESLLAGMRERGIDEELWSIPAFHPLVVDDMVLMRTVRTLLAVDFQEGKQIWEIPVDDPFKNLSEKATHSSNQVLSGTRSTSSHQNPQQLELELQLRVWGDSTYGTLASDGERVFSIEDVSLTLASPTHRGFNLGGIRASQRPKRKPSTRLTAYDIHTGKLLWHVGGLEELGLPLSGAFFLGPPLPLMNRLYIVADNEGEIRLYTLDAKTGNVLWSQQLAQGNQTLSSMSIRRLSGVSPAYVDGVLVCPTSDHAIVAVDLATRSLRWGYQFPPKQENIYQRNIMAFGISGLMHSRSMNRWAKSDIILVDNRVLVTPIISDYLHCINLIDGKQLWKSARGDHLYVACAYQGKVILVGKRQIQALNLEDGKPATSWETAKVPLPQGSMPSGTGFASGKTYYLPLSSAEVMALDMETGHTRVISKSRQNTIPGNLVCYKGQIISQRADAVESFYQSDSLEKQVNKRLAVDANDAAALSLRGELLWHRNKLDDSIVCFEKSLKLDDNPKTRYLLRQAIFDGFRADFASHRHRIAQIESILETPSDRSTFLRLLSEGLEQSGEFDAALKRCLEMADLDATYRELEPVGKGLSVRSDRSLQMRLASLRTAAPPEARKKLDLAIQQRLAKALEAEGTETLERFLDIFGSHTTADAARSELCQRYINEGRLLEVELVLRGQQRSSNPEQAAAATVHLVEMLQDAARWEDAAVCCEQLRARFAEVVCSHGKTGLQWVDALAADDPVRQYFDRSSPWPKGAVQEKFTSTSKSRPPSYYRVQLDFQGNPEPFFRDNHIELNLNPPTLTVRDGVGQQQWTLPLTGTSRQLASSAAWKHVAAEGHLLLLSLGNKLWGIDTLGKSNNTAPRILWTKNMSRSQSSTDQNVQVRNLMIRLAGVSSQYSGSQNLGPSLCVSDNLVCFLQHRYCTAVDPSTGEVLWVRKGVKTPCAIFGDHEYVFLAPSNSTEAMVLRAADGKELGKRRVPSQRLKIVGRNALIWQKRSGSNELKMIDLWDGSEVWKPLSFSSDALVSMVDHKTVGVCDPKGRFYIIDINNGMKRIDAKMEPNPKMFDFRVLPSFEGHVLVVMHHLKKDRLQIHPLHNLEGFHVEQANLYGFDRQGKSIWSGPTRVEDQFVLLNQPHHLPVIACVCMKQAVPPNKSPSITTNILAIDRRNGRVLADRKIPNGTSSFQILGDPKTKTVRIESQRNTITMTFTDNPLPPKPDPVEIKKPPAPPKKPKPQKKTLIDLLRRSIFGTPINPAKPIEKAPVKEAEPAKKVEPDIVPTEEVESDAEPAEEVESDAADPFDEAGPVEEAEPEEEVESDDEVDPFDEAGPVEEAVPVEEVDPAEDPFSSIR